MVEPSGVPGFPAKEIPASCVNRPAGGRPPALHHGLGEGRVRMDRAGDFLEAALQLLRDNELCDQLGGTDPDDVCAEQLPVPAVAHDLHHPLTVAVDGRGADATHREPADDDVVSTLRCLGLGETEARDLWG